MIKERGLFMMDSLLYLLEYKIVVIIRGVKL